ncbi:methionine synthase vitamin-B12 independent [Kribbella sandramycini]|uniref:Methionine synthase II (Cobalamin-independent) n=1 Tax=Kribbella sandramycini TaxID=60450 RepID=A0A7Y4L3W0_9ACTN|nr:methionine synthase vitamin-B12 independent [Kribbella sandramycini]MBB6570727.1 methionine synthase II (cobalamin-independent) [Kribbella sandramycini]NOL43868.1 methionine synthase vitamin-B12 independent [Kribbella sandramycini]
MTTTGLGSLPGEDIREWTKVLLEAVDVPFLAELPARPYGDMLSRAIAVLTELAADLQPAGWRLTGGSDPRASVDQRRARSLLAEDLDVLEELAYGYSGPLKLQVTGPWTLAATLELPRGDKVLADHGARRDLAQALAAGVQQHVAEVRKRVPGAELLLQLDEPALPAVLAGAIPTASGWGKHRSVDGPGAVELLSLLTTAAPTVVHCCAARPPIEVFTKSGATGLAVDISLLNEPAWEQIALAAEAGATLYAGLVPTTGALADPERTARPLLRRWEELGLDPALLRTTVITPTCGLAGADDARARLELCRRAAEVVAEFANS